MTLKHVGESVCRELGRAKEQLGLDQLDLHHHRLVIELDDVDAGICGG